MMIILHGVFARFLLPFSSAAFEPARVVVPLHVVPAGRVVAVGDLEYKTTRVANAEFILALLEARGESELPRSTNGKRPRVDLDDGEGGSFQVYFSGLISLYRSTMIRGAREQG